ncbi:MAG: hypothetical protein AAF735_03515 [Myxococcota bacterium]
MSPVPNGLLMLPPFMDGLGGLRPAFTPSTARSAVQTEPTLQNSAASLDALVASSGTRSRTPAGRLFAAAMRSLRAAHGDSAPRNPAKHIRVLERFVTGLNELEPRAVAIEFSRITETPVPPRQRAEVGRHLRTLLVANCDRLLGELRKADLEQLAESPRKQWIRSITDAWGGIEVVRTVFRPQDWRVDDTGKPLTPGQRGARQGNCGDMTATAAGLPAVAAGDPIEILRLAIFPAGVQGGFVLSQPALKDAEAETRSNWSKAKRPLQHPDRAFGLVYAPAALSLLGIGAYSHLTTEKLATVLGAQWNVAGMSEGLLGASLLAAFASTVLLNDPMRGRVVASFDGDRVRVAMDGIRCDGKRLSLKPNQVVEIQSANERLSLFEFLAKPESQRPAIKKLQIRRASMLDHVGSARNSFAVAKAASGRFARRVGNRLTFKAGAKTKVVATQVDWKTLEARIKARACSRLQIMGALMTIACVFNWGMLAEDTMAIDWISTFQGFRDGRAVDSLLALARYSLIASTVAFYSLNTWNFLRDGKPEEGAES